MNNVSTELKYNDVKKSVRNVMYIQWRKNFSPYL